MLCSVQCGCGGVVRFVIYCFISIAVLSSEARAQRVLTSELLGEHELRAMRVAVSPNGKYVASCAFDRTARIWNVDDGKQLHALKGHGLQVESVAFNADGTLVATGAGDKLIRIWNVADGKLLRVIPGHSGTVFGVRFAGNQDHVISCSGDHTVRIWNCSNGKELKRNNSHSDWVVAIAVSADGELVASGGHDKTIRLWRPEADEQLAINVDGVVMSVAVLADGKMVSAGIKDTVEIYNAETGKLVQKLECESFVYGLAVNSDESRLACSCDDGLIRVWNLNTRTMKFHLTGHKKMVYGIRFGPRGEWLVSASWDKTVRLWRLPDE